MAWPGDIIDAGHGDNVVLGDNGFISAAAASDVANFGGHPMTLGMVESTSPTIGGDDSVTTGMGSDIVLGGAGQ